MKIWSVDSFGRTLRLVFWVGGRKMQHTNAIWPRELAPSSDHFEFSGFVAEHFVQFNRTQKMFFRR